MAAYVLAASAAIAPASFADSQRRQPGITSFTYADDSLYSTGWRWQAAIRH